MYGPATQENYGVTSLTVSRRVGLPRPDSQVSAIEITRIAYGSPLRILARLAGLPKEVTRATINFFKGIIFYDSERSRRDAEAGWLGRKFIANGSKTRKLRSPWWEASILNTGG